MTRPRIVVVPLPAMSVEKSTGAPADKVPVPEMCPVAVNGAENSNSIAVADGGGLMMEGLVKVSPPLTKATNAVPFTICEVASGNGTVLMRLAPPLKFAAPPPKPASAGAAVVTPEKLESMPVSTNPLQSIPEFGEFALMPPPVMRIGSAWDGRGTDKKAPRTTETTKHFRMFGPSARLVAKRVPHTLMSMPILGTMTRPFFTRSLRPHGMNLLGRGGSIEPARPAIRHSPLLLVVAAPAMLNAQAREQKPLSKDVVISFTDIDLLRIVIVVAAVVLLAFGIVRLMRR
jgi:hypothetical protein